jgi:hypothetical protein
MIDEVKPGALFPASDPLKELGFKWRWWGRPSYAAWPHGSKGMTRQLLII